MSHIFPEHDLDLSFLYEIADGSDEFIVESIDMFLQQTPDLLQNIEAAIGDKDWTLAAQSAHKLKPNLGFFGMPLSQATIQEVELMAKAGAPDLDLLVSKFNDAKNLINPNLDRLVKIKADKEAGL
ncbi:MAG TPA: Hpt domain-containing protein [Mucilaginibacter sp.]|nr:Hpt domain-containing protein [Mucilaginibacter sp.]